MREEMRIMFIYETNEEDTSTYPETCREILANDTRWRY
ncbi:hypothetical protein ACPOL_1387 [Acidisarcina polymorpha]|uniref:Uncharacterized protein n=1 Tax=Acidisarcina polymorpha TaxID=2211140 RepID=A0A2Z5FWG9_9BACT|nr:hypothetical protein ACPOL_1387 [Acidisarcina polymorpha]